MNTRRLLWFTLVALIVWAVVISLQALQFQNRPCIANSRLQGFTCAADSPIAHLELATRPEKFQEILGINQSRDIEAENSQSWNGEVVRVNTCLDFLFIALYFVAFILLAGRYSGILSVIAALAIVVAAIADLIEDVLLFHALKNVGIGGSAMEPLPGMVSRVKWSALACTVLILAWVISRAEINVTPRVMSALMALSGLLMLLGALVNAWIGLLGFGLLFLLFALCVAVVWYYPFRDRNPLLAWLRTTLPLWIEFAYLIRFQLIFVGLIAIVFPVLFFLAPSVFVGLFDGRTSTSFTFVSWTFFQLAFTAMICIRLVRVYGPDRFAGLAGLPPPENATWFDVGLYGGLALPSFVVLCCGTDITWIRKVAGGLVGIALSVVFLFLAAMLHYYLEPAGGRTAPAIFPAFPFLHRAATVRPQRTRMGKVFGSLLSPQHQGGIFAAGGRLRSGHQLAGNAFAVALFIYAVIGFCSPAFLKPENQPAALLFAVYLLVVLTWLMSGVAFFFDAFRLPVLTTLLLLGAISGILFRTDHQFRIAGPLVDEGLAISPRVAVQKWAATRRKSPKDPLVVVAAAGGGIRAAAWTAKVLTELETLSRRHGCANTLDSSLVLISSVSGGSVGSMFFLRRFDENGELPGDALPLIRADAYRSSLSAVGWGLLYPDFVRTFPVVGGFIPQYLDRGWALESAWTTGWRPAPNMSQWRKEVFAGKLPAVIFNATSAESGQRFLIGSSDLEPRVFPDEPNSADFRDDQTMQFAREFSHFDLPVATAARLSATFPYVSPAAKASEGDSKATVHVVDGGYYDNSGVFTALEWLEEARPELKGRSVALLRIDAEPAGPKAGEKWSWERQIAAPVSTLLNVRTASQQLRAGFETELVKFKPDVVLTVMPFLYSSSLPSPLSWHLTPEQQDQIATRWKSHDVQTSKLKTLEFLGCRDAGTP